MRPGKIGEIKQVVRTPASWNAFIAASRRSMLTALSISARKSSSSVFDRPGYPRIGECFNEVKVTQHQVRLGSNTEATFAALHLLQNGAGAAGGFLQRLIWVGHVTEKQFFPCIPLRVFDFRPKFNVYELSSGLRVIGKTLHKRCVAIFAAVATAHIRIDRIIITHRQIGFCEDAFYFNVSDDWLHCMYAPLILLIFHGTVSSYPSYRQNRLFDTAACLCLRFQDKFLKYAADEPALQAT